MSAEPWGVAANRAPAELIIAAVLSAKKLPASRRKGQRQKEELSTKIYNLLALSCIYC